MESSPENQGTAHLFVPLNSKKWPFTQRTNLLFSISLYFKEFYDPLMDLQFKVVNQLTNMQWSLPGLLGEGVSDRRSNLPPVDIIPGNLLGRERSLRSS